MKTKQFFYPLVCFSIVIAATSPVMANGLQPVTTGQNSSNSSNVSINDTSNPIVVNGSANRLISAYNDVPQNVNSVTIGVFGQSNGVLGRGVVGFATSTQGATYGVIGRNYSPLGGGVYGHAHNTTGQAAGVLAVSQADRGYGLLAEAWNPNGINFGVFARSRSPQGRGVVGVVTATTGVNYGVIGRSLSDAGTGVWGDAPSTTGNAVGVYGVTRSPQGAGVVGANQSGANQSVAIRGVNTSKAGSVTYGIVGYSNPGDTNPMNKGVGVFGVNNNPGGHGVYGYSAGGGAGVYGHSGPQGWAGYFNGRTQVDGNVQINGNVTISGQLYVNSIDATPMVTTNASQGQRCVPFTRYGVVNINVPHTEDIQIVFDIPADYTLQVNGDDKAVALVTPVGSAMPNLHIKVGPTQPVDSEKGNIVISGVQPGQVNWMVQGTICRVWFTHQTNNGNTTEQSDLLVPLPVPSVENGQ